MRASGDVRPGALFIPSGRPAPLGTYTLHLSTLGYVGVVSAPMCRPRVLSGVSASDSSYVFPPFDRFSR